MGKCWWKLDALKKVSVGLYCYGFSFYPCVKGVSFNTLEMVIGIDKNYGVACNLVVRH